jgi:uncharacterized protein YjbI with pentapeptide repeats
MKKPLINLISISILGIITFFTLASLQQNNIDVFNRKIENFSKEVDQVSSFEERVKLKRDILGFEKDKATIKSNIYGSLVQALGGIILGVTAYVGWRNFKIAEDKQVTERFSKAIEHLGNEKIDIRLGGIYALEQIAKDSPAKYHWTITTILTNFICDRCSNSPSISSEPISSRTQSDTKSALIVLGRRTINQDPKEEFINLRNVKLISVEIQGVDFSRADFSYSNLSDANLSNTVLSDTHFREANLSKARFIKAKLSKAKLQNANFNGTDLEGADLKNADLSNADLRNTNLSNTDLSGADLSGANLNDANLSDADLKGAILNKCLLVRAKLIRTDLIGADLSGSDFMGADFSKAKLIGTDLREAINLERIQIQSAFYDTTTKLPDSLNGMP